MKKSELVNWLQEEYQQWEVLLDEIGPERMERPGVNGVWSMKDMVAHLFGWHPRLISEIQAAQRGEPAPPPPWPAHLKTDDEINAWIYETNHDRPLQDVLDEARQLHQQLLAVIEGLPNDVRIDDEWRQVWLGDQYFPAGELFDHFHDDHEPDIRAWLVQTGKQSLSPNKL